MATPEWSVSGRASAPVTGAGGGGLVVRNAVSGGAGAVVQVGVVRGDVHLRPTAVGVVPRQLPAAPGVFVGRRAELAALDRALTAVPEGPGRAVAVSSIGGVGGIGKTWLALAWAHRNLHRFPDGQLFVDLRGFSPAGRPTEPADAVRGFLVALGVDPGGLPADLDAQAALYRGLVAGRRLLVVLDNAATAEQVVPLLPGSGTCTVLVTGRTTLPSLIDRYGARHVPVGVLRHVEARALLVRRLGGERVEVESEVTDELVGLCGRHPLALAITARHAAVRPAVPLVEVAGELREQGLEMLDHDTDPAASLPAVLSWSLRRLTEQQRMVFALLGAAPGPDIDVSAAACLAGVPVARARAVLRVLEEHCLLDRHPRGRYRMHDLVRAYAAAVHGRLAPAVRRAASGRVVGFYLRTAYAADLLLSPHRPAIALAPPAPGACPQSLPDLAAALVWLDVHHPHLLAAQHAAVAHDRHRVVVHLAWTLTTFHLRRGHRHDALAVWRCAAAAAVHLPEPAVHALVHRRLGHAEAESGRYEQAVGHLCRALALAERHRDPAQRAHTHQALARVWEQRGEHRRAWEHARCALELYRVLEQPVPEAVALNAVGWCAAHVGEHGAAREHCRAALALFRRHGDPVGEADTLDSLGWIAHHSGRHHRAIRHYRRALVLFRSLGHTANVAGTFEYLGHPHRALGRHERARVLWLRALGLYRRLGRGADVERVRRLLDDLG